ncbi:MAG: hypothetical protein NC548_34110 [Lachnospiraceae bacterium]|nr:hypothetical protein [Lachnospiraceae bacterium]
MEFKNRRMYRLMQIDDKHLLLLNKLIYDPRIEGYGMISSIELTPLLAPPELKIGLWYKVFYSKIRESILLVDDIKGKKIKFLMPFDTTLTKELEHEWHERTINELKEYYGDDYSDDILMYMPEEERLKQIKQFNDIINSLECWERYKDEH